MRKYYLFLMISGMLVLGGFSGETQSKMNAVPEYNVKCCKICKKGKACGDSCISRSYTCHKPKGCACDG
jgi:hypothetical protein